MGIEPNYKHHFKEPNRPRTQMQTNKNSKPTEPNPCSRTTEHNPNLVYCNECQYLAWKILHQISYKSETCQPSGVVTVGVGTVPVVVGCDSVMNGVGVVIISAKHTNTRAMGKYFIRYHTILKLANFGGFCDSHSMNWCCRTCRRWRHTCCSLRLRDERGSSRPSYSLCKTHKHTIINHSRIFIRSHIHLHYSAVRVTFWKLDTTKHDWWPPCAPWENCTGPRRQSDLQAYEFLIGYKIQQWYTKTVHFRTSSSPALIEYSITRRPLKSLFQQPIHPPLSSQTIRHDGTSVPDSG